MNDSPHDPAAVEQLLAERDALLGWLARLDQAPAGAPHAVRDRVRADYQQRLDQLTAGLRSHADVVSAKLADDRREHDDLLGRATSARDGLAEAELRHAVGEYDDSRFQGEQRRFSSDIETFGLALAAAAERIARLEEIHALVERGPRAPDDLIDEDAPVVQHVVEVGTVTIADLAPDDEGALSVFDEPASATESAAPPATSENGPLSFRPSGAGGERARPATPPAPRPHSFESAPPLGIPAADVPPRFIRPGERLPPPPAPPAAPPVVSERKPEFVPGTPADVAAPGPGPEANIGAPGRTLRCGECGAMNRPLEWYCEKCGAELTAV